MMARLDYLRCDIFWIADVDGPSWLLCPQLCQQTRPCLASCLWRVTIITLLRLYPFMQMHSRLQAETRPQ